jgi:hypothetical protein
MHPKDVYVITYGSRWAWRFEKGVTQKLCKDKFEAIEYAKAAAKQYDSDVYVEQKDGTFKKLKI